MKLEGSLDAFSLSDIFTLLSMTAKTGSLHLRHREGAVTRHAVVHFTAGALTGGSSDASRQALARRIVGAGHADDDALRAAVERAGADATTGVARALREAGAVGDDVLVELATEQVHDAVFDLLRWPDGEFSFIVDTVDPDDVGARLGVDEVVAEARRRLDDWSTVTDAIPSPDAVLRLSPGPVTDPHLTGEEWALLALVDGRRSVRELGALAGRGEYAVARTLAAMVERGLLCAGDEGADALARRQALLAPLERATGAVEDVRDEPDEAASLAAALRRGPRGTVETVEMVPVEPAAEPVPMLADLAVDEGPVDVPARPPVLAPPVAPTYAEVSPARPEPFLPRRRPEHPEEALPSAMVGAVDGATAMQPDTEAVPASIERDPSVNKSLLLRLIAGVRGL